MHAANQAGVEFTAVFIDMVKGYDLASRKLTEDLCRDGLELPEALCRMVEELYTATAMVDVGPDGVEDVSPTKRGVFQGCPISPKLYDWQMTYATRSWHESGEDSEQRGITMKAYTPGGVFDVVLKERFYCDDASVYELDRARAFRVATSLCNHITRITGWMPSVGEKGKTEFSHLGRRSQEPVAPQQVCGSVVHYRDVVKYLGVHYASDGRSTEACIAARDKVVETRFATFGVALTGRGTQEKVRLQAYCNRIRPTANYGAELWILDEAGFAKLDAVEYGWIKRCLPPGYGLPHHGIQGRHEPSNQGEDTAPAQDETEGEGSGSTEPTGVDLGG